MDGTAQLLAPPATSKLMPAIVAAAVADDVDSGVSTSTSGTGGLDAPIGSRRTHPRGAAPSTYARAAFSSGGAVMVGAAGPLAAASVGLTPASSASSSASAGPLRARGLSSEAAEAAEQAAAELRAQSRSSSEWKVTNKGPPRAGYKCKVCHKEGGEPDSHWFQLCPQLHAQRSDATQHRSRGRAGAGHHRRGSSSQDSASSYPRQTGDDGKRGVQPPRAGYVCKHCGQPGGEPGAHWFQQCEHRHASSAMLMQHQQQGYAMAMYMQYPGYFYYPHQAAGAAENGGSAVSQQLHQQLQQQQFFYAPQHQQPPPSPQGPGVMGFAPQSPLQYGHGYADSLEYTRGPVDDRGTASYEGGWPDTAPRPVASSTGGEGAAHEDGDDGKPRAETML